MSQQWGVLGRRFAALVGVSCLVWSTSALCAEQGVTAQAKDLLPTRDFINLRFGASTGSKRMEMCLEVSPLEAWSLEACGTGSEILHHENSPELAHFRGKYSLTNWKTEIGWLQPRVGLGITELQVGRDDPGFQFLGVGPRGVETAGPEASIGIRGLYPLIGGFDLVGELSLSMAWLRYAPQLATPQSQLQPAVSLTVGGGF
jgi:hypothetical protein